MKQTLKLFIALYVIFLVIAEMICFGQNNAGNPGFFITQPFVGNNLLVATNQTTAQQAIGITNWPFVATNALTNHYSQPAFLDNGASVSGSTSLAGDLGVTNNAGHFSFDVSAASEVGVVNFIGNGFDTAGEFNVIMTNDNASEGVFNVQVGNTASIYAIDFLNLHGGNVSIDALANIVFTTGNGQPGWMIGNGFGLTNLQSTNIIGQIPLSIANTITTNSFVLASNQTKTIALNLTNFVNTNAINLTNFVLATSNSLAAIQAGTTNLTANTVTTNLYIAGVSEQSINLDIISLEASSNLVNLVYTKASDGTWTNVGSGYGIFSNTVGGILRFNNIDSAGNILFFKTNSPQGNWVVNFVATTPPVGDWGRLSDFGSGGNAEALVVSNLTIRGVGVYYGDGIGLTNVVSSVNNYFKSGLNIQDIMSWSGAPIYTNSSNGFFEPCGMWDGTNWEVFVANFTNAAGKWHGWIDMLVGPRLNNLTNLGHVISPQAGTGFSNYVSCPKLYTYQGTNFIFHDGGTNDSTAEGLRAAL